MIVAEVIGKVTLSKWHPSLQRARWRIAVPLTQTGLKNDSTGRGDPLICYDDLGASEEGLIAVTDGAEASAPFYPEQKPIDAYNSAILDTIDVD